MNDLEKKSIECLKNMPIEETTYQVARNVVLDYITNLQEENDLLKRDIEAMKHNYNLLVRCIENGESMTQKFENGLTYQDYKSRNEKAIEYITSEETINMFSSINAREKWLKINHKLLKILQGEDKDDK